MRHILEARLVHEEERGRLTIRLDDLTSEEKHALERLFSHGSFPLLRATADGLINLGLAEQKLGGVGISRTGEELVVQHRGRK